MNLLASLAGLSNTVKAVIGGALLAVILILGVGLFVTRHTLGLRTEHLALCNAKQATNLATIDGLLSVLAEQNAQVTALAAAGDAKQKAAQDALRAAVEREKASQATVGRLKASAAVARAQGAPCVVSDALASARGL